MKLFLYRLKLRALLIAFLLLMAPITLLAAPWAFLFAFRDWKESWGAYTPAELRSWWKAFRRPELWV
ncbi:hypothetical protein QQS45_08365 [Alteriqipengyuania flavescens]|uniref:hypothetical protein n=1 Tax=Alteriqipengyuania flavescens TaxID=3053610 RepID=UPI0025B35992|nr:hypothetical protein [Alteriqipengyuania flavescens]WJY17660.1 hypothetical protein QQW98_08360 [Alteriqipengyuania flavescens]WJY23603.1 hypothetical protein QQS45_08365 [Alteriqipengyuania flavescens]